MASRFPESLRQEVFLANLRLVEAGLVVGTWGNASGYDAESGLVAIKPSGLPYGDLRPEHLVVVDLDGAVVEGELRPSSDLPTHLELYRRFPGLGGVAHTHSTAATAFAQARRPLPCLGTTHADHFRGTVPVTRDLHPEETANEYELNTGRVIVATFANLEPLQIPAVLVAQHGPFTWGPSPRAASENSVVLEAVAQMALRTYALAADAQPAPDHLIDRHFLRKHGPGAYYGQR
ncbi:MAG: L-ribulose-5-phosphate 4-epimerase AraD [Lentisphaeria bacterium]|jgi:L-ribulose-5-phosphate 4-epimerase|nr:L-ribulose-5-phosphate 4-epimerase AraD [Lentisphaeria bacterium]